MNNYLALCEILYHWIMGSNPAKNNGDKDLSFRIEHHEENKIELIFGYLTAGQADGFLSIDEHFPKQAENHVEFTNTGYAFDINDALAIKYILYTLAEKYILWENGGEDTDGNKTQNWGSEDYYKEDIKDPRYTSTYYLIKMIDKKIKCKMSWKDFQKQKMLDSFATESV